MPEWIHSRANYLRKKNPNMSESEAWGIATNQAHATGHSPKGYGTAEGRRKAKQIYTTPKDDEQRAAPKTAEEALFYGMHDGVKLAEKEYTEAQIKKLLRDFGPPDEWSGSIAMALGPERRKAMTRAWEQLPSAERASVEEAFHDNFEKNWGKHAASSLVVNGIRIGARRAKKALYPRKLAEEIERLESAEELKLANIASAKAQLAQGMRRARHVGANKGPSVNQLAKPEGFGRSIPGANKGGTW